MSDPDRLPAGDTEALVQRLRAMPKVVLHDHLDGSLRPATLLELLRERGQPAPADNVPDLEAWFYARSHAGSLTEYLRGFALTVEAMSSLDALERVAFEAAEDALADGAVLGEFRIAPLLFEDHGLAPQATVEALLAGLSRSALPCGLILCAMRHLPAAESERVVELALRYRQQGVVAFDLAGAELGHPPSDHARALRHATEAGLPLTLHAGEADGALRVVEAVRWGARRIGHGVRLVDALASPQDRHLFDDVRSAGVHLEVCPTSNVHTGAAASIAAHPITALWRAGVSLSFHTDNRLMSQVTHTDEARALLQSTPLQLEDLARMQLQAAEHSFLPDASREAARRAIRVWADEAGLRVA
jgi:adenosine deaminase